MQRPARTYSRRQPEFMGTFHHFDVQHGVLIEYGKVYGFLGRLPQLPQDRPRHSLQVGLRIYSGGHLRKPGSNQIRPSFGADEISLPLQVFEKAMSRTLVNSGG